MNERILTSLSVYLKRVRSEPARKSITTKLKRVLDFNTEIDSEPVDAYRMLGKVTIRIQLIEELNKFIMEHATTFSCAMPWARELWELREHCKKQAMLSTEMARALIFRGHLDGLYREDSGSPETKPTTAEEALCTLTKEDSQP